MATDYADKRERAAARERATTRAGQDIGKIPTARNKRRREKALGDFAYGLRAYFPGQFYLKFSEDQRKMISRGETAIKTGGIFALAAPRGSGKTVIIERLCLLAILGGFHLFTVIVGADLDAAVGNLESLKVELETNDRLAADFPEAIHPIRALEGSARRCEGQRFDGARTYIRWGQRQIVLATIPGAASSGAVIRATGLTGHFRGLKHGRPDGTTIRPTLFLADDCQTDESAKSGAQCDYREQILCGALLGLAGPDKQIAGFLPGTIIQPDDVMERMTDHARHPEWGGERLKLVYSFPSDEKRWEKYRQMRAQSLAAGGDAAEATAFYRRHRKAMDAGAVVGQPARFRKGELSAIQYAMNMLADRGRRAFAAEFQGEPIDDARGSKALTAKVVSHKLDARRAGEIPAACEHVTAMVDVHDDLLYWCVCAWQMDFAGFVVTYGAWPDQRRPYFKLAEARPTLRDAAPPESRSKHAAIVAGLTALSRELMGRDWTRADGTKLPLGLLLIDAGYLPKAVRAAIKALSRPGRIYPSLGRGISAANRPIADWEYKPGDRRGNYWGLFRDKRGRGRTMIFDANWHKSQLRDAFVAPLGEAGSLSLFGQDPKAHGLIADHCAAEYPVETEGQGRKLEEWKQLPAKPDNHFFDCLVGCTVGASFLGCRLPEATPARKPRRRRRRGVSYL